VYRGRTESPPRTHAAIVTSILTSLVILCGAQSARAQTWGERLGFPPEQRVLLLHVSEAGVAYETNAACEQALEGAPLRSTAALVPGPWFEQFAAWARAHEEQEIGLDLTLTSPFARYHWNPILPETDVPSLVDRDGHFWSSALQVLVNVQAEDAEKEVRAQIERARDLGVEIDHLHPHLGVLYARSDLTAMVFKLAREYWIPTTVVELTPTHIERFAQMGLPMDEATIRLIRDYPLPKLDDLRIIESADTYEEFRDKFFEAVRGLEPGITEIALQPAIESDALKQITPHWQRRVFEAQLLADPEVQKFFEAEKIGFTNWDDMMRRFEGTPEPSGE